jgi:hypothetical protein
MKSGGVKVLCEPRDSISDSSSDGEIEFLKVLEGGFQNADGIQGSQSKTFANCGELLASFPFGNGLALAGQAFPERILQNETIVRIPEEFYQLLLNSRRDDLGELFLAHMYDH